MALYDGFFDATLNEETYQYDREYNAGDFVEYFGSSIGSGVCIYNNVSSMKVTWDGSSAVVAPGYLFIDGYWLKNDGYYYVPLSGTGTHAVLAYLNTGARRIEIISQMKADPEEYPNCLCLAYVTLDAGTVEDTRYNTDICGVIDSAGDLSNKVEYAINFIDNEVEGKLAEAEAAIEAQALLLDEKIAEVNAQVEKLAPDPIGTVKFSATSAIEEGWLRCDGSFINETDYPELVAALGKKYPSGDKFVLLSDGEIGQKISNMALYDGRIWVYSYTDKKLYGVSIDGGDTKAIPVTSESIYFDTFLSPTPEQPIVLSIVPHKVGTGARLFLAQVLKDGFIDVSTPDATTNFEEYFLLFSSQFSGSEDVLSLAPPVTSIPGYLLENKYGDIYYIAAWRKNNVPFVFSDLIDGVEHYYCLIGYTQSGSTGTNDRDMAKLEWTQENAEAFELYSRIIDVPSNVNGDDSTSNGGVERTFQKMGFSPNNNNENVAVETYQKVSNSSTPSNYETFSAPLGLFKEKFDVSVNMENQRTTALPLAVAGTPAIVYDIQTTGFAVARLDKASYSYVSHGIPLPSGARVFYDGGCYLNGKDIYLIFLGTGILFSRELIAEDVGYLDTTSVLGTITQYGHILHSQDENTLFLVGQDTSNKVKVAKMVLNTLFDYANDGAWLPLIASDGVPAYIKAFEPEGA